MSRHSDSAVQAIDNLLALCYDDSGLVDKLQDLRSLVCLKLQHIDLLLNEVNAWMEKVRELEEGAARGNYAGRYREEPEPDRGDLEGVLERSESPAPPGFSARQIVRDALQPRAKRFPRRNRRPRRAVGSRRR